MGSIKANATDARYHDRYFKTIRNNFVYTVRKFTYRVESKFYCTKFFIKNGFYYPYNSINGYSYIKESITKHANNNAYYDFFSRLSAYTKYLKIYKIK